MRISFAQIDPVVGAFEANAQKILEAYQRACSEQARLLLTPEMGVCGYPPFDLIDRPEMIERNEKVIEKLLKSTQGQKCALAVGHLAAHPQAWGRKTQNVVSILEDGKLVFRQAKTLLPTYDVFDEARYFEPAAEIQLWNCDGKKIAVAICEDLWAGDEIFHRRLYSKNPVDVYAEKKADLVLSLSSSPYEWEKRLRREKIHKDVALRVQAPVIYLNQVGATDEILFDGGSFVLDSQGNRAGNLSSFKKDFGTVLIQDGKVQWDGQKSAQEDGLEVLSNGLVTGIQEYFKRTKFSKAIIGLSGGIDSAVVATLAVKALGSKNVHGVGMPSQYSSSHSLEDAEVLAKNLGITFEVRPIKFLFSTALRELSEGRGQLTPIAVENLQSRLRGLILMTLSNHYSSLVLTTGNKSEIAMGYCTMYGDMVGALAPIGDLFKTRVYQLAHYLNQAWGNPIPNRSLTKAPSAELKPNQTDQDTLPPYDVLDAVLELYLEKGLPIDQIDAQFSDHSIKNFSSVRDILKKLELNEYKRRQAAPVLKVSSKAFGIGRRVPIAKQWE